MRNLFITSLMLIAPFMSTPASAGFVYAGGLVKIQVSQNGSPCKITLP